MIWAALTAVRGFLAKLPWQIWAVLGAFVIVFLAYTAGKREGHAQCEAKHAEIAARAVATARKADGEALGTVKGTKDAVEAENAKARDAAKDSEDPLKDGLGALR